MKKILVTGGGGYIGSVLCEVFLNKGYAVVCLDRFFFGKNTVEPLKRFPNFHVVQDDIRFIDKRIFKDIHAVIDLAGISNDPACELDPVLTEEVNHKGCVRLAEMAKEAGVERYIFSSSCSIYGTGQHMALTEESPLNPVSLYAKTKIASEKEIKNLHDKKFCVTCLRNATVYGYSRRMRFDLLVNLMTAHAVTKGKIFVLGGGKQWRPNIHVKDLCKAFILILESSPGKVGGEIFNVGVNEQNYQVIQVANMIREVVPYVELEIVPDDVEKRNYNVNFDKIKNVLGFKVERTVLEGAVEVKQAIERAEVDFDDIRTITLKYYKYLIDADRILNEVKIGGRLF